MAESKSTKQKTDSDASIDRISSLPNALLFKILSFIPFKQAVATSILSNTWRSLCLSRPSLQFDDGFDAPYIRSSKFLEENYYPSAHSVDFALISPRPQKSIRNFHLKRAASSSSNPSDVARWVETAIQRKVEIFDVCLSFNNVASLPSSVFTCSTIVVLRLKWLILNDFDSVCLPSLKILHLKSVTVESHESITKLLHGCTILEDLALNNVSLSWDQDARLSCACESFPKLIRAKIDSNTYIRLKALSDVELLQICPIPYQFYYHYPVSDAGAPTFHNLVSMEVTFYDCDWQFLDMMLQYSPKLHNLVICKKLGGGFSSWYDPKLVPECLSSHLRTCYLEGFDPREGSACVLPFAKYVVENGRVLETMTILCMNPFAKNLINQDLLSWQRSSPACVVNVGGSSRFRQCYKHI